jgi:hypothetical protein
MDLRGHRINTEIPIHRDHRNSHVTKVTIASLEFRENLQKVANNSQILDAQNGEADS